MMQEENAKGSRKKGTLNIRTDPRLHREFAAACALKGETIQDRVSEFMRTTVAETFAAFRPGEPA